MLSSIILFLLILSALVIIHELGHMFVAKYFGVRVHEFGLGYPPKAKKLFSWHGTDFTLNWIPFGGFVRLEGETTETDTAHKKKAVSVDSLSAKPWYAQIAILMAGVVMNFLFAWFLLSGSFMAGAPSSTSGLAGQYATDVHTTVAYVLPDGPAAQAGIRTGDRILGGSVLQQDASGTQSIIGVPYQDVAPESLTALIKDQKTRAVQILFQSGKKCPLSDEVCLKNTVKSVQIIPKEGIIPGARAVGISLDSIGTLRLPIHRALGVGFSVAVEQSKNIVIGFGSIIGNAFTGKGSLKEVSGPVGIVGIVHDVQKAGWVYVVSLMALISLNLAVLNLVPFPALDGGRIFVILIEAVIRRPLPEKFTYYLNLAGFSALMLFMLVITYHDIVKLIK